MAHGEVRMKDHLLAAIEQFPSNFQTEIIENNTKEGQVVFRSNCSTEDEVEAWMEQLTRHTEVLGPRAFGDQNYPTLIMTDDSKAERDALKAVWPESMLLLCHFHVLQAVWRWITEKGGIEKGQWKKFLEKFKAIVYAETEEEAEAAYASAVAFANENGKENYVM